MKKQTLLTAIFSLFLIIGINNTVEAQLGRSLIKSMRKKGKKNKKKKGNTKAKFAEFSSENDEMKISGQYFSFKEKSDMGLRFVKSAEGKIVNQLHVFFTDPDNPTYKFTMKESYYRKHQIKMFFVWPSASASSYIEMVEVDPGVFAVISGNRSLDRYEDPIPLFATREVVNVFAKDMTQFDTWDIETAQAKLDMIVGTLKGAASDKTKKKLMKYDVYKNYVGKIAFAKSTNVLRNQKDNQPTEKEANFITKQILGETVAFKPYFEKPLEQSHPGAWFNITYEMAGQKTDREALRNSSSVFGNNIPQIDDDKGRFYFWFPRVTINTSNNVADYAFLELLRLTQDKLTAGKIYDLKITIWAYKDGANIDPVASGTIQLEYATDANKTKKRLFEPVHGWVSKIEDVLDE
ncbi:hypothetical protein [Aquimarina sediminis]|uniref:hypothetical protein n=1 Tax=Aquimarina sediminis TaxID=2070536 RepID=UPI000CA04943|nr:hypothetical protein [Aquimarina sediminis]